MNVNSAGSCSEGVIRASRSDEKSLIDLETFYCGEGIVAAALRPDLIVAPPDSDLDPALEFLNEQIKRQTRANKKLLWNTEPGEWEFWGQVYWTEQRKHEEFEIVAEEKVFDGRLEWHGLGIRGQEVLAELREARKKLPSKKKGCKVWRHRFCGGHGWNDLGELGDEIESISSHGLDDSENEGALYSAIAAHRASLLDAIDKATKSQTSSELPYYRRQDHGTQPLYADWGPLRRMEPDHPAFTPPEKAEKQKEDRSKADLGAGQDYLGFASESSRTRHIKSEGRRLALPNYNQPWAKPVFGGFLLAISVVILFLWLLSMCRRRRTVIVEERRGRVHPDDDFALEKVMDEAGKTV